jgi:hypothetical protein
LLRRRSELAAKREERAGENYGRALILEDPFAGVILEPDSDRSFDELVEVSWYPSPVAQWIEQRIS